MRLLQEDFVIRFSSKRRKFSQIRSFGKWVLMMCFLDSDTTFVGVQNLSPEKCVRVFALMWPLDYLWNPLTRLEDLPTDRPHPSCHPSGIPDPISWWLVRHFARILNLKMSLMQPNFQRPKCIQSQQFLWWRSRRRTASRIDRLPWNDKKYEIVCLAKIFSVTCWVLLRESRTAPIFLVASVFGSITEAQRSRANNPSIRCPASREMTSDFVELCETEVCFLHIQLTGTNVWLPNMHKILSEIDFWVL